MKKNTWELLRFYLNFNKVKILSYCDVTWGHPFQTDAKIKVTLTLNYYYE